MLKLLVDTRPATSPPHGHEAVHATKLVGVVQPKSSSVAPSHWANGGPQIPFFIMIPGEARTDGRRWKWKMSQSPNCMSKRSQWITKSENKKYLQTKQIGPASRANVQADSNWSCTADLKSLKSVESSCVGQTGGNALDESTLIIDQMESKESPFDEPNHELQLEHVFRRIQGFGNPFDTKQAISVDTAHFGPVECSPRWWSDAQLQEQMVMPALLLSWEHPLYSSTNEDQPFHVTCFLRLQEGRSWCSGP